MDRAAEAAEHTQRATGGCAQSTHWGWCTPCQEARGGARQRGEAICSHLILFSPRRWPAFRAPQAFALRQPAALRQRLAELRRDAKLNKLPKAAADAQQAEVLAALRRLGGEAGKLTPDEEALLAAHEGGALLEAVRDDGSVRAPVVRQAGTE